ncbi:hypothetical protein NHX12_011480 [Muraenolepis orangiensis]|uniref:Nephrocystin 3-like N-terminal domain-containing protein n=1 Tax=Muraenolepis orangiensis TaxID=630683 RepID=A0A9Q0DIZ7_9TELE|nr:hypothetical protein NHX12_011480 [Muraenolepis orangiensis]
MAQTSLLQGKRFYCRDWVFHKIQHCLQEKTSGSSSTGTPPPPTDATAAPAAPGPSASTSSSAAAASSSSGAPKPGAPWGVLLVGGPGSGKTAVATELLWPTAPQCIQRGLQRQALAFHFCRAAESDTLSVGRFVRGLVAQLSAGGLLPGYRDKLLEAEAQKALLPGECERNPAHAFKR